MWEVDPETKSKLALLQKRPGNTTCIDCSAPSPQWASPKYGTFICLTCAGLHRGLGVHISFVRSIQMDSFKPLELQRMDRGGNTAWRDFWEAGARQSWGRPGEGADAAAQRCLEERYGGGLGEEYKERLACAVEGREFVAGVPKQRNTRMAESSGGAAAPLPAPAGIASRTQKERNEDFFARKGGENSSRPEGVAPSRGGKYAGFGSEPAGGGGDGIAAGGAGAAVLPSANEFQADPVAALSKGFGWFASTVGKGAKSLNDGYIQPTAQKIAESDVAAQARVTAAQAARQIQQGTKGAAEKFNHFVEGGAEGGAARSKAAVEPERRDFWDSFGDAGGDGVKGSGAIGTAAMRKGGGGGGGGGEGKGDGWDNW